MREPADQVRDLVTGIVPADDLESAHRSDTLRWLGATRDIYRRARPATPPRHLVSYAVLLNPRDLSLFLVDHRLSGLRLPPGGHVEPGEDPAGTVRREAMEELGIEADFAVAGSRPAFLTVTHTTGPGRHTDVSLWYLIGGDRQTPVRLDPREFTGGRWWTPAQIAAAGPASFEPHLARFLAKAATLIA
jgi:8-oxo-dGTP diphosphatase